MLTEKLNLNPADLQKQDRLKNHLAGFFKYGRFVEYGVVIGVIICIISGLEYSLESLSSHSHHLRLIRLTAILEYILFLVDFFAVYAIECTNKTLKPEYQVSTSLTSAVKWMTIVCGILNCIVEAMSYDGGNDGMGVLILLVSIALIVIMVIWAREMCQKWSQVGPEHEQVAKLVRNYVYLQIGVAALYLIIGGMVPDYTMNAAMEAKYNRVIDICYLFESGVVIYFYALFPEYYQRIIDVCSLLISTGKSNEKNINATCASCKLCEMSKDGLTCSLTHSRVDFGDSCANYELDENL